MNRVFYSKLRRLGTRGYNVRMTTIVKTKRYKELVYRHLKLIHLYSVMSELNLHTNTAVGGEDVAKYYLNSLFSMGMAPDFFRASLESMRQVFYIELNGFIGAYWDNGLKPRKYESYSLAKYLYDGKRQTRKKTAQKRFEELLQNKASTIDAIWKLRGDLSHFVDLDKRNANLLPSDLDTRNILNALAEVLWLLGYQPNNTPHYIDTDGETARDIQNMIDRLLYGKDKSNMRKKYLTGRKAWFKNP